MRTSVPQQPSLHGFVALQSCCTDIWTKKLRRTTKAKAQLKNEIRAIAETEVEVSTLRALLFFVYTYKDYQSEHIIKAHHVHI
jgi:hypothetical protein